MSNMECGRRGGCRGSDALRSCGRGLQIRYLLTEDFDLIEPHVQTGLVGVQFRSKGVTLHLDGAHFGLDGLQLGL